MNATWILSFVLFLAPVFNPAPKSEPLSLSGTASPEAKAHFDKGLLLLHNFEYGDARDEFVLAQQAEPDFAMAAWGKAMTYDHPIWRELDIDQARAALKELGPSQTERIDKGKNALEKDFIHAIDLLFGEGSKPDREKAYSEFLGKMYLKYKDNQDVAAFYALSLLALKDGWEQWEEYNERAAKIASDILKLEPDHAGALHYLVHADDHPRHAANGLAAADKYAKVASYAGHALHMPSHIYLALGMWDDVVRSNEVSFQAGVDRRVKKGLPVDQLNYHAHLWLMYGYLQQGRYGKAKQLVDNQVKYANESKSTRARYHLLNMKGHYLFSTNDWKGEIASIPVKVDDLDASTRFTAAFLEGYRSFELHDATALNGVISQLSVELQKAEEKKKLNNDITVCGSTRYNDTVPGEDDIRDGLMYLNALKGMASWLGKDMAKAEEFLRKSLPPEGSVVVGPPHFLLSPYELYGRFLLSSGRAQEALVAFDHALAASPNRYVALTGKLNAAKTSKEVKAQEETLAKLHEMLKNADAVAIKGLW